MQRVVSRRQYRNNFKRRSPWTTNDSSHSYLNLNLGSTPTLKIAPPLAYVSFQDVPLPFTEDELLAVLTRIQTMAIERQSRLTIKGPGIPDACELERESYAHGQWARVRHESQLPPSCQ